MSIDVSIDASLELPGLGKQDAVPYRFAAMPFPPGHFIVHAIRGREALSRRYAFDVTVTTKAFPTEDLARLALGQRAALIMSVGGPTRVVPGVVARVRSDGVRPHHEAAQFTLRLVPSLWLLRHRKGSSIYQEASVDEVVERVLHGMGIQTRWMLTKKYPKRAYCTQYEETDLAFVERLCAEAGIFYWFAPPLGGMEALVGALVDTAVGGVPGEVAAFAQAAAGLVF